MKSEHLAGVKAVYDRASLVAFPPHMRQSYVNHLRAQLPADTPCLLVSLEFDAEGGPPFSLSDAVIEAVYGEVNSLKKLGAKDLISMEPRFQEKGCSYFLEKTHLIRF